MHLTYMKRMAIGFFKKIGEIAKKVGQGVKKVVDTGRKVSSTIYNRVSKPILEAMKPIPGVGQMISIVQQPFEQLVGDDHW